jgi:hypothetical protein
VILLLYLYGRKHDRECKYPAWIPSNRDTRQIFGGADRGGDQEISGLCVLLKNKPDTFFGIVAIIWALCSLSAIAAGKRFKASIELGD